LEKGGLSQKLAEASLKQTDQWVVADEMRLGLHGQVRRVWAPRGVKVRQKRQIVYEWAYLVLAVDGIRGEIHWEWTGNVKKETIAPVVASWRGKGIGAIVWDGAGYHKAHLVRDVGVPLIGLPSQSPELNPTERVIEEIRGRVEGRVYDGLQAKRQEAEAVLQELAEDPERVRRLAGWHWIREAHSQLTA
jgi:hypothetical protein